MANSPLVAWPRQGVAESDWETTTPARLAEPGHPPCVSAIVRRPLVARFVALLLLWRLTLRVVDKLLRGCPCDECKTNGDCCGMTGIGEETVRPLLAGKRPSADGRNPAGSNRRERRRVQTSVCSAISSASSTSMPRYRTVLSNFVCPSSS
jgi:hypothetical protein